MDFEWDLGRLEKAAKIGMDSDSEANLVNYDRNWDRQEQFVLVESLSGFDLLIDHEWDLGQWEPRFLCLQSDANLRVVYTFFASTQHRGQLHQERRR